MKTKNGKRPLGTRQRPTINPDDTFSNKLALPEAIKKDLEAKGLEAHWLDGRKLQENGGYHDKDWVPYQKPEGLDLGTPFFKFGNDPDGIFRRGSLVLGVKKKEQAEKHRAFLKQRAERYRAAFDKDAAAQLKQQVKENGLSMEILEGFDANEDE